ncbi:hypothetical protein FY034_17845 (plasmid) [Trichlorobacter lovleyi]|uniref:hypothetical protein n=1 Tax=Trichlorobacter lovleyi TaxID=313985 RepID=UPI00224083E1|nr:hypothetical protein [Trichlorobacter lovleyi]QOX80885.1 hypothetical protein FY034_17845 [Trichlorobacter lovleyi]
MLPTAEERALWRFEFEGRSFTSSIGECCPSEFGKLLDAVNELEQQNNELAQKIGLLEGDAFRDVSGGVRVMGGQKERIRVAVETAVSRQDHDSVPIIKTVQEEYEVFIPDAFCFSGLEYRVRLVQDKVHELEREIRDRQARVHNYEKEIEQIKADWVAQSA